MKGGVVIKKFVKSLAVFITAVVLMLGRTTHSQLPPEENLAITIQRLEALNDTGELDRLISEGRREVGSSQVSAEKCLELGLLLTGKALYGKDLEEAKSLWLDAIHYLEKSLTLSPKLAEPHAVIGHLYLCPYIEDKHALSKSKRHFQRALSLDQNQSIAKEGMRRIALRSSQISEKETYIKHNLNKLSRVTRSGRKFSVLSVEIKDSLQACDLITKLELADVSRSVIIDSVQEMKYMGGVRSPKKQSSKPDKTIGSIIRLIGEVSGLVYANIATHNLELDRIGIVLHSAKEGPVLTIFTPVAKFRRYTNKQISLRQLFGSMSFIDE